MGLKSHGHGSPDASKFPKLSDCAHFHYEYVYLKHIKIQLFESEKSNYKQNVADSSCWPIQVSNEREYWVIWRNYSDFFTLDNQLHCCVYDRRTSKLPKLPKNVSTFQIDSQELIENYIKTLEGLSWDLLCCGPCLNWFELDNRGNQIVALCDKSDINTPAIAGAIAIQDYEAQNKDEVSLKCGDMVSVISMPPKEDSIWWKGKRSFQVGYFPSCCVTVIREDVPECVLPYINAFHNKPRKASSMYNKNGKLKAFICNFLETRPSRRRLKQAGILKERVFGCDLGEHLLNTSNDIPVVLKSCAEFIEKMGIVDGVYRLSGISSNIQRLRNCFDEDGCPDLFHDEQVLKDIHCVTSVLKMYFRELPNPLLTYQLYNDFISAIRSPENQRMIAMKEVVRMLPPPHFRTLKFLCFHLKRISEHSNQTNMSAKNLAIVWAPNLLRCEGYEHGGISTLQDVGLQAVITEFLICCANWLLTDTDTGSWVSETKPSCFGSPVKLLTLREAQKVKSCQVDSMEICDDLPDGEFPATYHTIINIAPNNRNNYRLRRSWRNLWGCRSLQKIKFNHQIPYRHRQQVDAPSNILWPVKSADSLISLQTVGNPLAKKNSPFNHNRTSSHDSYFHKTSRKPSSSPDCKFPKVSHTPLIHVRSMNDQSECNPLKVTKSLEAVMQIRTKDEKLCQSVPGSLVTNSVCDFTDLHSIIQSFPRPTLSPNIPSSPKEDYQGLLMTLDGLEQSPPVAELTTNVLVSDRKDSSQSMNDCLVNSLIEYEQFDASVTPKLCVSVDVVPDSSCHNDEVTCEQNLKHTSIEYIDGSSCDQTTSLPTQVDHLDKLESECLTPSSFDSCVSQDATPVVQDSVTAYSQSGHSSLSEDPQGSVIISGKQNVDLSDSDDEDDWYKPRIMAVHPKKSEKPLDGVVDVDMSTTVQDVTIEHDSACMAAVEDNISDSDMCHHQVLDFSEDSVVDNASVGGEVCASSSKDDVSLDTSMSPIVTNDPFHCTYVEPSEDSTAGNTDCVMTSLSSNDDDHKAEESLVHIHIMREYPMDNTHNYWTTDVPTPEVCSSPAISVLSPDRILDRETPTGESYADTISSESPNDSHCNLLIDVVTETGLEGKNDSSGTSETAINIEFVHNTEADGIINESDEPPENSVIHETNLVNFPLINDGLSIDRLVVNPSAVSKQFVANAESETGLEKEDKQQPNTFAAKFNYLQSVATSKYNVDLNENDQMALDKNFDNCDNANLNLGYEVLSASTRSGRMTEVTEPHIDACNGLKSTHGLRQLQSNCSESEGSNAKRLRIEQYKEKRREYLRERFKMENFMNSENDELLLRLKSRVSSNRRLHCDCLTECGHDKISSGDRPHENKNQFSKTHLESVVTTVSDLQAELKRTSRESTAVSWYSDITAPSKGNHKKTQEVDRDNIFQKDSLPPLQGSHEVASLKKTERGNLKTKLMSAPKPPSSDATKSLPTTPVDVKEPETWPRINLRPVRWSSVDSSSSSDNKDKFAPSTAKGGHVLEMCKKFSPDEPRVRCPHLPLSKQNTDPGKFQVGPERFTRSSLYDKM